MSMNKLELQIMNAIGDLEDDLDRVKAVAKIALELAREAYKKGRSDQLDDETNAESQDKNDLLVFA